MTAARVRDFAIYIVIGLCVAFSAIWFAWRDIDVKWLTLLFQTALVFGSAIGMLKRHWRRKPLWISLCLLLTVHLSAFILVLQRLHEWRAPNAAFSFVIETSVVVVLCELLTATFQRRTRLAQRRRRI